MPSSSEAPISRVRYHSPLRYPGGKGRLLNFFNRLIDKNGLTGSHYAEPYAGGAGLALGLLHSNVVSHIHINDLDRSIYALWHTILTASEFLCAKIKTCPLTIDEWRRQQAIQRRKADADLRDLGFSTFFLNRTNRSGIIRSGGPIGGVEQAGQWTLDARFNRNELIGRVTRIAKLRKRINIHNVDALEFIERLGDTLPEKGLVYMDPPYYVKGRRRLYASSYSGDDHAQIAALLDILPWPWAISYDSVPEIRRLYRVHQYRTYSQEYSASNRCKGREIMFFSPGLRVPTRWSQALHRTTLPSVA